VAAEKRHHSFFELAVIVLLVGLASWQAWHASAAGLLTLFHSAFIICAYLLVRLLVGRLNWWLGSFIFAVTFVLLTADTLLTAVTGMHINPFILSLIIQPGFSGEIGLSPIAAVAAIFGSLLLAMIAAKKLRKPHFTLRGRALSIAVLAFLLAGQILYSVLHYRGQSEIEEIRRELPFFTTIHPYNIRTVFGIFPDAQSAETPFSLPQAQQAAANTEADTALPGHDKNILLVIADSMRAKDIKARPELMPNLQKASETGFLSLNHYSVSNCTHFSFYSMFTGKLPTAFGSARRAGRPEGMLQSFAAAGYSVSTSESYPLDWYDTASIIFPSGTKRYHPQADTQQERDRLVTENALAQIAEAKGNGKSIFHTAYYFGSHFPYDTDISSATSNGTELYQNTLKAFDAEIGKLFEGLEASGALADTIVVVTSDHGESISDTDGTAGHASKLTNDQIQVPLLVVNQTAASLGDTPESHLAIGSFLLGQPKNDENTGVTILANCSYDYPKAFAVLTDSYRADFDTAHGYLTPTPSPDGSLPTKQNQLKAAALLIKTIENQ
jgi:membrane-anchored protein YejM (alkaline phosphatase superfamily)